MENILTVTNLCGIPPTNDTSTLCIKASVFQFSHRFTVASFLHWLKSNLNVISMTVQSWRLGNKTPSRSAYSTRLLPTSSILLTMDWSEFSPKTRILPSPKLMLDGFSPEYILSYLLNIPAKSRLRFVCRHLTTTYCLESLAKNSRTSNTLEYHPLTWCSVTSLASRSTQHVLAGVQPPLQLLSVCYLREQNPDTAVCLKSTLRCPSNNSKTWDTKRCCNVEFVYIAIHNKLCVRREPHEVSDRNVS